jgi:hypothetical protein
MIDRDDHAMKKLFWRAEDAPVRLHAALRALGEEYPIGESPGDGAEVRFQPGAAERSTIIRSEGIATIHYDEMNQALRGLGTVMAGLVPEGGDYLEDNPFTTFGFMLDCSRNAVMKPEHVKRWLRRLALLGYNMGMLYTEDTYEIPGEEFFGYQRGRYTGDELKELDAYAAALGIELIGCIQTLGHLEQVLRWPAYRPVRDTDSVLLAGEDKTYRLIARMLDATQSRFRSSRIHIGMDEAPALGRGVYLEQFGSRPQFDIFTEHLNRVAALCRDRGLRPMIWSDMLFALSRAKQVKVEEEPLPLPLPLRDVQLVYWEYYHGDKDFYLDGIRRHRDMGFEPVMASGIWTWAQLWYNRELTEPNAGAAIDACRSAEIPELFFTLWGDDGAYCDFDSALAGLAFTAERAFNPGAKGAHLPPRFQAVCGASYEAVTRACELTGPISFAGILWDDPLLGIFQQNALAGTPPDWPILEERFALLRDEIEGGDAAGDIGHAALLADVLARKIGLRRRLEAAYAGRDRTALGNIRDEIPEVITRLERLAASWRRQWLMRNKPFGLEVLQIRLAGQMARYRELAQRLTELLDGQCKTIPELETHLAHPSQKIGANWRDLASGSSIV